MVDVGAVNHHAAQYREFGDGGTQQRKQFFTQQAPVKRHRLQRPTIERGATQLGEVVRVLDAGTVFHL